MAASSCVESLPATCILCCVVVAPLLWQASERFRFVVKMLVYYYLMFLTTLLSLFFVLPFPYAHNRNGPWLPRAALAEALQIRVFRLFHILTGWMNLKWEVRGVEHAQRVGGAIFVGNHQSSLDVHALGAMWPQKCGPLVKQSLLYAGPFGLVIWCCGAVFVDRSNPERSRQTSAECVRRLREEQSRIFVFPEGTRNHEDGLLPFKKGAFHMAVQAQLPIVPVVFSSYRFFYSKKAMRFLPEGFGIIEFLPPIATEGLTEADVTRLSEQTRAVMLDAWTAVSAEAEQRFRERRF